MNRLSIFSVLFVVACGGPEVTHYCKINGKKIATKDHELCNIEVLNGKDGNQGDVGPKGEQGLPGRDGESCSVSSVVLEEVVEGALVTCSGKSVFIKNGLDGKNGIDGLNGKDGINGVDGKDGIDGTNGKDGVDGKDSIPIQIVDPCGDAPNIFDEVILKLPDGGLLASFSDDISGRNTRFSRLTDGNFITTDGSSCRFSVIDGKISW